MAIEMGPNRYGKAGIRLATVRREGTRNDFSDLTIDVRLEGDFASAHTRGDNAALLPTDTMRATCYALAREHGVDAPEPFALLVAERLLTAAPAAGRAEVHVAAHPWERLLVGGSAHPHAFRPGPGGDRTATVTRTRDGAVTVTAGVAGLRLLKTTGSAFCGFARDRYTVLAEAEDRVMATTVHAAWRYRQAGVDHDRLAAGVPETFSTAFACHDESQSLQHTLYAMGQAVLDAHAEVGWIRFRLPNEHHVLADLSAHGLDNPGAVFVVGDRPYGVIEGTVTRTGVTPDPLP